MREADFVKVAKALADPTRYRMLQELRRARELTCSCMCDRFPLSQPTISHHIKTLEEAGLIVVRREGQFHVLAVNEELLRGFVDDLTTTADDAASRPAASPGRPAGGRSAAKRKPARRKTVS